ncbi:Brefeldin A-inhibited guanine nucleotide-exchange protein 4 [Sesamum angolense]|uniref:Brefeldin A-inhibited guanine nucleotide-exchange protein 4 n=1 Tax=Sesamum angolense TaxID=2727404 RepID=A0AAE2BXH0_9LAMI|nr:Brefeldin A-inhibited guanine nucleotide-exchange protein 4 [Sesamum angolense]
MIFAVLNVFSLVPFYENADMEYLDIYYALADPTILRFMVEVCWGPMLAAFSVTLGQTDDKEATTQCLQGFRYAVHVTAGIGMQTQRDAFVTTVAKFTYLHCAADMKQKNVDAVKAIISIAIEDGNYLSGSMGTYFNMFIPI